MMISRFNIIFLCHQSVYYYKNKIKWYSINILFNGILLNKIKWYYINILLNNFYNNKQTDDSTNDVKC